jgi:acetate kinase
MNTLVINPGSSSIKFSIYAVEREDEARSLAEGELSGIGEGEAELTFRDKDGHDLAAQDGPVQAGSMHEALGMVERAIANAGLPAPEAVGYRVVHPGPSLKGHQRITPKVLAALKDAVRYAPLHEPMAIELIEAMMQRMPTVPHVACFDTVFHETIPEAQRTYALPGEVRAEGVRRYGFHGLSCESVVAEMSAALGAAMPERFAIAHLGSGCSVTACVGGASIYNSMGLTPAGGVVMGTRPGDLDPGVVLYLLRRQGATADSVEAMLNHHAGLKALGGINDMRELRRRSAGAGEDATKARMALQIFVSSVARSIAGLWALDGVEAVVFTGGIGEHDAASRLEISSMLTRLGIELDARANAAGIKGSAVGRISAESSRVAAYVARADEDRMIARHVGQICFPSRDGATVLDTFSRHEVRV